MQMYIFDKNLSITVVVVVFVTVFKEKNNKEITI